MATARSCNLFSVAYYNVRKMVNKTVLPREFWAVNASNLFERGAYYGMLAVFSYHLVYNVGIESWMVGILASYCC
jgi:dipeptide/tripeptide permease